MRRPFLIEGFLKGILGGVLALLLTWIASVVISRNFVQTAFFSRGLARSASGRRADRRCSAARCRSGRHLRKV